MDDPTGTLLAALQFGDGQFPGGAFAFSWGLESLVADGMLARAGFAAFLEGQLRHRWASFDRILVAHAHAATEALPDLDDLTDALMTVDGARRGSRRAGAALLATHLRLGTPGATGLKASLPHVHLPIVQGAMLAGVGLDGRSALAVSGYAVAQSLCTAAIRLGLIGHLDAQRALSQVRPLIARIAALPQPGLDDILTFVPVTDIAMMRHSGRAMRLFSN